VTFKGQFGDQLTLCVQLHARSVSDS